MRVRGFVANQVYKAPKLESKKKKVQGCDNCDFQGKKIVLGSGDTMAEYVIVSDAPRKGDELSQIPFMSNSGKLFREILFQGAGISEDNVYFTSTIKCVSNRVEEIPSKVLTCCKKKLSDELTELKNKKLIITLGAIALDWFVGKRDVSKNRSYFYDTEYGKVMSMHHPVFIKNNFSNKDILGKEVIEYVVDDLKRAKMFLDIGRTWKQTEGRFKVAKTMEDLKLMQKDFNVGDISAVDFETTGVDIYRSDLKVVSVAFSKGAEYAWCIPFLLIEDEEIVELAKNVVRELYNKCNIQMFNAQFDQLIMKRFFNVELKEVSDIMLMWFLLHGVVPERGMKLKRLVLDYTDWGDYGVDFDKMDIAELSEQELVEYNCVDTLATAELFEIFWNGRK